MSNSLLCKVCRKSWAVFYLMLFVLCVGCTPSKNTASSKEAISSRNSFLKDLLQNYPQYFDTIARMPDSFRVQIIYTRIDRKKNNDPVFTHYYFNVDPNRYFYPASTIKMPITLLALEKLNRLKRYGIDKHTAMITEADYSGQSPVYNDPTSADGKPSIAHYIKKIFLASNNDAFNRLYEFLGQEYINTALRRKGYYSAKVVHRLSIDLNETENRYTNPLNFINDTATVIYRQAGQSSALKFQPKKILIGEGYLSKGKLISEPFDFSDKNSFNLIELHSILQSVVFPGSIAKKKRFKISDVDRRFVLQYMSQYPSETLYPQYDSSVWDGIGKLLLWGFDKRPLPTNIRIFNKVGGAYGFLTDVAYVADFEKRIEFMISASIYCNSDRILNDDRYDYLNTGFPFMKHLGEVIFDFESSRPRKYLPDLTEFKMTYEK